MPDWFNRVIYALSGVIYMAWTTAILIGFWYIDVYFMKVPLAIEIGVTAPAIVLEFAAFSFILTAFGKNKLP